MQKKKDSESERERNRERYKEKEIERDSLEKGERQKTDHFISQNQC